MVVASPLKKGEKIINFGFKMDQNRLTTHIELWVALVEIHHRVTYI